MKSTSGATLSLSGMGSLKPIAASPGKHGYEVDYPEGNPEFKRVCYFLKAEAGKKTSSAGNFFGSLVGDAPKRWQGLIGDIWKCSHKSVHSKIEHIRPVVATTRKITLEKGIPVCVGGWAEA
jgi:hypothetical protein